MAVDELGTRGHSCFSQADRRTLNKVLPQLSLHSVSLQRVPVHVPLQRRLVRSSTSATIGGIPTTIHTTAAIMATAAMAAATVTTGGKENNASLRGGRTPVKVVVEKAFLCKQLAQLCASLGHSGAARGAVEAACVLFVLAHVDLSHLQLASKVSGVGWHSSSSASSTNAACSATIMTSSTCSITRMTPHCPASR